jgi:hypothetical protein
MTCDGWTTRSWRQVDHVVGQLRRQRSSPSMDVEHFIRLVLCLVLLVLTGDAAVCPVHDSVTLGERIREPQ